MTDNVVNTPTGYIFRPYRVCPKTGEKIWAKAYGKKAWKIPVYGYQPQSDDGAKTH